MRRNAIAVKLSRTKNLAGAVLCHDIERLACHPLLGDLTRAPHRLVAPSHGHVLHLDDPRSLHDGTEHSTTTTPASTATPLARATMHFDFGRRAACRPSFLLHSRKLDFVGNASRESMSSDDGPASVSPSPSRRALSLFSTCPIMGLQGQGGRTHGGARDQTIHGCHFYPTGV